VPGGGVEDWRLASKADETVFFASTLDCSTCGLPAILCQGAARPTTAPLTEEDADPWLEVAIAWTGIRQAVMADFLEIKGSRQTRRSDRCAQGLPTLNYENDLSLLRV
jgi:hypothetical protein